MNKRDSNRLTGTAFQSFCRRSIDLPTVLNPNVQLNLVAYDGTNVLNDFLRLKTIGHFCYLYAHIIPRITCSEGALLFRIGVV
jgi:hypothetical protein